MRTLATLLTLAVMCLGSSARASFTADLIWADTGTPTLTITAGDAGVPAAACAGGQLYAGSTHNRCLTWRLTAAEGFSGALSSIGWNQASSGIAVDFAPVRSFGRYGATGTGMAPVHPRWLGPLPNPNGSIECEPACDTVYSPFGGVSLAPVAAGSYTLGSIGLDLSGATVGTHALINFIRTGVGGAADADLELVPLQVNGATLTVIPNPEPTTAALLGLGILALAAGARRRS